MVNPIYQQGEELMLNPFGSKYLGVAAHTDVNSNEFIVQEDAIISVLTGGDSSIAANDVDYKASMSLSGVTLKQGALIVAPQGESFQSMTIDSGTIMAYNSVVGGTKPASFVGLLDDYPNAVVAYSLRKLTNAYSGDAIEVRRTVGTPTNTDIGFVDDELDTASLLSFVGSGSGFIPTWYDQSGNTNTQSQSSASAQPNTVDSGTLVTLNGNPTARFGSNRFMQTSSAVSLGSPSEMWIFTVLNLDNVTTYSWIYGCSAASNNDGGFNFYVGGGNLFVGIQGTTYVELKTPITTGNKLISVRMRGGQTTANAVEVYIDSELATLTPTWSGTSNATFSDFTHKLGARESNLFRYIGDISEFLIKTGDQSANRAGIESNINNYYDVY